MANYFYLKLFVLGTLCKFGTIQNLLPNFRWCFLLKSLGCATCSGSFLLSPISPYLTHKASNSRRAVILTRPCRNIPMYFLSTRHATWTSIWRIALQHMVYEDDQAYLICTIAYNFLLSKLVNIYVRPGADCLWQKNWVSGYWWRFQTFRKIIMNDRNILRYSPQHSTVNILVKTSTTISLKIQFAIGETWAISMVTLLEQGVSFDACIFPAAHAGLIRKEKSMAPSTSIASDVKTDCEPLRFEQRVFKYKSQDPIINRTWNLLA